MISAIILAAGQSRRMGRPKMLLPWKDTTILGQVITTLGDADLKDILVITGAERTRIEGLLLAYRDKYPVRSQHNSGYAQNEMLASLQLGLSDLHPTTKAALVVLGDQPQIQAETISLIQRTYRNKKSKLIVPSYRMRRGHPWLIDNSLWDEFLSLGLEETPRDFLNSHNDLIEYINVETASILQDIDYPEDYQRYQK